MTWPRPAAWKATAATGVANTLNGSDETAIFQIHQAPDAGDTFTNPCISIHVGGGGVSTPELASMWVRVNSNPNPTTHAGDTVRRTVWEESDYPTDVWQYWVIDVRPHWDAAQSPHLRVWRAVGAGALVQLVNDTQPNQVNNVADDYPKGGVYYWADAWTGGLTERVIHSKGIHRWSHSTDMTAAGVLAYLRGI